MKTPATIRYIGTVRRSQALSTYGPGAIIDFRNQDGAPVSAVGAGLDEWDNHSSAQGTNNTQTIYEPRLQKKLEVAGFRLPPVGGEPTGKIVNGKPEYRDKYLPAVRFPNWHFCPQCDLLQPTERWHSEIGRDGLSCPLCSLKAGGKKPVYVVPVRFILACPNGHLDEFPWRRWAAHQDGCSQRKPLKLVSKGAGLKGLRVECTECQSGQSMEHALAPATLQRMKVTCSGNSPWLPGGPKGCTCTPVAVQRGASNTYFPVIDSALDIPPWGDSFQDSLGSHWSYLNRSTDEGGIRHFIEEVILPEWDGADMTADQMFEKVMRRKTLLANLDIENLRGDEYLHLTSTETTSPEDRSESDFEIVTERVPSEICGHLSSIVRVERLREVRVLRGFTRLSPPFSDAASSDIAPLSEVKKRWLPAIEVRGEGIFLALDEPSLNLWEARDDVRARTGKIREAAELEWEKRTGSRDGLDPDITPRFLLIHTLSHAFMEQLSLECGYGSSSLRERLYVASASPSMAGVLIYTSAPDTDGTLGGLVRQGHADRVRTTLFNALKAVEWCSADPLCSEGLSSASDGTNLAACHACVFIPETGCEHFNRYLDRALLVGTPEQPDLGYFHDMIRKQN